MKVLLCWFLTNLTLVGTVNSLLAIVHEPEFIFLDGDVCVRTDSVNVQLVGSRLYQPLSEASSVTLVEIIPIEQLSKHGQIELSQLLNYVIASYTANRQSGSSLSDHIDPFTMKGFGPDEILVLINGKRKGQSSLVNLNGTIGKGNANIDFNSIPVAAIERIEYLKDGASGQYGTDAIAGVLNIVLKSSAEGVSVETNAGVTSLGDGLTQNYAATLGMPLVHTGQFVLTADYLNRSPLVRIPTEYYGESPRKQFGEASVNRASLWFNANYPLSSVTELYSFGGFTNRGSRASGWNILPSDSSHSVYSFYPTGYVPVVHSAITDIAFVAGLRTSFENGWDLDFSESYSYNSNTFDVSNTVNPSLNSASPTSFDVGQLGNTQNILSLTLNRIYGSFLSGLSISLGMEHRHDNFWILAGEEASWKEYPNVLQKEGGAQGMIGFRPSDEQNRARNTMSVFTDNELSVSSKLSLLFAARADHASDVGLQYSGKFAFNWTPHKRIALRGSIGTNFKIPSLVNQYFSWNYNLQDAGFPNVAIQGSDSDVINALKVEPILPEKTLNTQVSLVLEPFKNFSLSINTYRIAMKDRVVLTEMLSPSQFSDLEPTFTQYGIENLRFFANMLSTTTQGIEVSGSWKLQIAKHQFRLGVGFSYSEFILNQVQVLKNLEEKEDLLFSRAKSLPLLTVQNIPYKGLYSFDYSFGAFSLHTSATVYAPLKFVALRESDAIYQPKVVSNASLEVKASKHIAVAVGGNNLFEMYPTKQYPENTYSGGLYDAVQMGFGGAYYFAKLSLHF